VANRIDLNMDKMPTDAELKRMFDAVPILEQYKVSDKVVRAGSAPIVTRARQLAPRSTPEDRAKRSKKQRAAADWDHPLWKTIKRVVRKYKNARGIAVVGPEWPKGNKAYFNTSPRGRRQVLWGRSTGRTIAQVRNWIVQAFDETKPQQLAAMKAKLKTLMREIWE
jgi:hypothetical protein